MRGGMNIKADAFGLQRVDQLRGQTRKINAQALDPVVEVGVNGFDHGVAATVVDVNGCDTTGFDVIEEAAVAHTRYSSIARSDGGAIAVLAEAIHASIAHHLPADQQHDADWQQPEGKKAPALIHEPRKFVNECKGVGLISETLFKGFSGQQSGRVVLLVELVRLRRTARWIPRVQR